MAIGKTSEQAAKDLEVLKAKRNDTNRPKFKGKNTAVFHNRPGAGSHNGGPSSKVMRATIGKYERKGWRNDVSKQVMREIEEAERAERNKPKAKAAKIAADIAEAA